MSKTKLKPANENPWYILMTLHGEQTGKGSNNNLASKNLLLWNSWVAIGLTSEELNEIRDFDKENDLRIRLDQDVKKEVEDLFWGQWWDRNPSNFEVPRLPDPREPLYLQQTQFTRPLRMDGAILNQIDLASAHFESVTRFTGAIFLGLSRFIGVKYKSSVDFGNAKFFGEVAFVHSVYESDVHFVSANFLGRAHLGGVSYRSRASFNGATFHQPLNIEATRFDGKVDFSNARFRDTARFPRDNGFDDDVNFKDAVFEKEASFQGTRFRKLVSFESASFLSFADFRDSRFLGFDPDKSAADFSAALFDGTATFAGACFEKEYPLLEAAVLPDTFVLSVDEDNWPSEEVQTKLFLDLPEDKRQSKLSLAKASIEKFRHAVGRQGQIEDEHAFFRREMHHQGKVGSWWQRLPIRVFGAISNYGHSIQRPMLCLFSVFLIPALLFQDPLFVMAIKRGVPTPFHLDGFALSFSNSFSFFGFHRLYWGELIREFPTWMRVLGGLQTVLGFIFLFFLGLGLRTRFRLR